MPTCRVCKNEKEVGDFYNRQLRKDNLIGECKDCTKARVRLRARTDPKVQAYDRARAKLPHRKAHIRRVSKKWREDNPEGYKAHTAVSNAVRDGKLVKEPCEKCGDKKVHAHHEDYSQPLVVKWLCPLCHHRQHADEITQLNERKDNG